MMAKAKKQGVNQCKPLRIALVGGESSGKTTLARALALHTGCGWVPEYGRLWYELKAGQLSKEDLNTIGREQDRLEEHALKAAKKHAKPYVFCDTTVWTTLFYAREMFGKVDPKLRRRAKKGQYDMVVLCAPTIDFDQDGTRKDEAFRLKAHRYYQKKYPDALLVEGSVPMRLTQVLHAVHERFRTGV